MKSSDQLVSELVLGNVVGWTCRKSLIIFLVTALGSLVEHLGLGSLHIDSLGYYLGLRLIIMESTAEGSSLLRAGAVPIVDHLATLLGVHAMDGIEARYLGHGHGVLHWDVTIRSKQV